MKQFMIRYQLKNGTQEEWHQEIGRFISALDNDPDLKGNFENITSFFRFIPQLITDINATTKMDNSIAFGTDSVLVNIGDHYLKIDTQVISQRSELVKTFSPKYKTWKRGFQTC